jgi:hypothetical protein
MRRGFHRHRASVASVLFSAAIFVSTATPGQARTWHVEKDGSGDFTTIQPAIDASAAGDTVAIGPGRYLENAPFSPAPGSWVDITYVALTQENLTVRGTDRDAVIIGPTTPNFTTYGPKGFATSLTTQRVRIENLTVENVHDGMYLGSDDAAEVSGCLIVACDLGIDGVSDVHPLIHGCEFLRCREGMNVVTARDGIVDNCVFRESSAGVIYVSSSNGVVRNCIFIGGIGGTQHQDTDGVVEGCTFLNPTNFAIHAIDPGGIVTANDNVCTGGSVGIFARSRARISGTGNLIQGTTYAGVLLGSRATCDLHFNDILPAAGYAVRAEAYVTGFYTLDLTNNYWGVETAAEIAARIWDSHDDPMILATVLFEPFAVQSVPTSTESFGGLKALFGPDHQ